jgi:hypothetical protein
MLKKRAFLSFIIFLTAIRVSAQPFDNRATNIAPPPNSYKQTPQQYIPDDPASQDPYYTEDPNSDYYEYPSQYMTVKGPSNDPNFVEDPTSTYYQYPSQYMGAKGPAVASRAGRTMGITTAEMAAGFVAVAVIVIGAVILTNNSVHQH